MAIDPALLSGVVDSLIERIYQRSGNGMALHPGGVLSMTDVPVPDDPMIGELPAAGLPYESGDAFKLNLIPVRETSVLYERVIPLSNRKLYMEVLIAPQVYVIPGSPPAYGVAGAQLSSMTLRTGPHGVIPPRINATVDGSSGATSEGQYWFFCGKLWDDGRVEGLSGADGTDDLDYFYPNLVSFGWLPRPNVGIHYPPIDLF